MFSIGVSIGLVAIDSTAKNLADVLSQADTACYAAKEKGRNCVYVLCDRDDILNRQRGQNQWIGKINQALEQDLFQLYTQKIVSLKEHGECPHYELLLRMVDESGKIIAPSAFLSTAERYDLMPAIDRWVVNTFLAKYETYSKFKQKHNLPLPANIYTINLSGASMNQPEFSTFLYEQFERYAVAPKTICFEITETVAISNFDNAIDSIEQLKSIGCSIALDDFSSGMSSFNYLKNLPVDYLKIDSSFIKNIAKDRLDYATIECFHNISQIMKIKTIAEFIENEAILCDLKQIGIDYAQGYQIGKPQPLSFS